MRFILKFTLWYKFYVGIVICLFSITIHAQIVNFEWANSFGASSFDVTSSIVVDDSGNLYATGWYEGTVDFDPSPAIFSMTSSGGSDA